MIRPRIGNFVYSDDEMSVMEEDIRILKSLGVVGFVFGVLTHDGDIDLQRTQRYGPARLLRRKELTTL